MVECYGGANPSNDDKQEISVSHAFDEAVLDAYNTQQREMLNDKYGLIIRAANVICNSLNDLSGSKKHFSQVDFYEWSRNLDKDSYPAINVRIEESFGQGIVSNAILLNIIPASFSVILKEKLGAEVTTRNESRTADNQNFGQAKSETIYSNLEIIKLMTEWAQKRSEICGYKTDNRYFVNQLKDAGIFESIKIPRPSL